jgi:hypothetical protein
VFHKPRRWYHYLILFSALLWPLVAAILAISIHSYNALIRVSIIGGGVVASGAWFTYMDRSGYTERLLRWLKPGAR